MIELTFAVDGSRFYLNPWSISRFYYVDKDKVTRIWLIDGNSVISVKEKPVQILKMLK